MRLLRRFFGKKSLASPPTGHSQVVHEPFTGAWQRNVELRREDVSSFFAVFSCVSKISQDISKLPVVVKKKEDGIWQEASAKGLGFVEKPNHYQTPQQFIESWINSKLFNGNAYIYKERNLQGEIANLYVLNPDRVKPLVDDDGNVFYQLSDDKLNQLGSSSVVVPASEVIHDRWNCFYHPLVGLSPVMACAVAAGNGLVIQKTSSSFFSNNARPSGILVTPGHIDRDKAQAIKSAWDDAYSGTGQGRTAVLGDDMKYQQISMSAVDSQLIEQLKLSAEIVCSAFKMPPFLIGFGALPAGMKVADLNELYYSSCLQGVIEGVENLLTMDTGAQQKGLSIEFDLDFLIRMDGMTQIEMLKAGVSAALYTPNEGREKLNRPPVEGGDSPYLQQQNFSLSALAKRDAKDDPFGEVSYVDNA